MISLNIEHPKVIDRIKKLLQKESEDEIIEKIKNNINCDDEIILFTGHRVTVISMYLNGFFTYSKLGLPSNVVGDAEKEYVFLPYIVIDLEKTLQSRLRPEKRKFHDKPYESPSPFRTRRSTRPWDNVWFSKNPNIMNLTIDEAIESYPENMIWYFNNLKKIKWSVFTVRLVKEKLGIEIGD